MCRSEDDLSSKTIEAMNFNPETVNMDYRSGYAAAMQQGPSRRPPAGKPRGRGRGRKPFQESRLERFVEKKGVETDTVLATELLKKLTPGVGTMSAADRLESHHTFRAITLCITTRAIGFGAFNALKRISLFPNVQVDVQVHGVSTLSCWSCSSRG